MPEPKPKIHGVVLVDLQVFGDDRGFFVETYRRAWLPGSKEMIQGNRADRKAGSIVGLHYHLHQSDYWYVPFGSARAMLHDLRQGSPTFGVTEFFDLGQDITQPERFNHYGLYIPQGIAHGFSALSDATITYLVDGYYNPEDELGVAWNDPEIKADWGVTNPIVSERDQKNPLRKDIQPQLIPQFESRD